MKLQEWAVAYAPDDKMLWKEAFWSQVMFVRDEVQNLLALGSGITDSRADDEARRGLCKVTATHRSKSIECPVYGFALPGMSIWARYNFYDWNISVESRVPLTVDFGDLFDDDVGYDYCFCQGMEAQKFGRYRDSQARFTVCVRNHYQAWTFFWLVSRWMEAQRTVR